MNDKIKILYIDDYELDRELVKDVLEKDHGGFELFEASNPQEFESLLKSRKFDVVLSDFNIAGFEGLQVLQTVRGYNPSIPVIIVTGTGSEEIAVNAMKQGASDYVIKRPQHIRKLPQTIFAAMEKQSLRDHRTMADARIRHQHHFLQTLMDAIPMSVFYKDLSGVYIGCNTAYAHFLGKSKQEIIGKNVCDIFPQSLADKFHEMDASLFEHPGSQQYETRMMGGDGATHDVLFNKAAYMDEDGNLAGLIGAMVDITHLKEMEKRLQQSHKMEAIGTLAGGIAHDFNNILSSILGFSELALDEVKAGSDLEDDLQEIYAAGKRAKDLVGQILAFARRSDDKFQPIQISSLAKEVTKFIRSSVPAIIKIKQNIQSDAYILGSPTQVYQVFMNLCTNAADAMEENGGCMKIDVTDIKMDGTNSVSPLPLKTGDFVEIRVSDTGIGINQDILELIFDPYFTTKPSGEGTGLGLSVVHGIVDAHGGRIMVDSIPGKGTTFTVCLPITRKERIHSGYISEALPTGSERILLVDDEVAICKVGAQILGKLGYCVTTKTRSLNALALFKSAPDKFDLVITDMMMPEMTGEQLAVEMLKIRSDIPIILCTGYARKVSAESALKTGIKAFTYKPIIKADMAKTVRKVLDENYGEKNQPIDRIKKESSQ